MANLTSLHGPRPVASVPSSASYRVPSGLLVTFAGLVRPSAVAASRTDRTDAARKAA
jgi:hypothetical protein